jgi:hypothetical protein
VKTEIIFLSEIGYNVLVYYVIMFPDVIVVSTFYSKNAGNIPNRCKRRKKGGGVRINMEWKRICAGC